MYACNFFFKKRKVALTQVGCITHSCISKLFTLYCHINTVAAINKIVV